jgi:hypothetical protein
MEAVIAQTPQLGINEGLVIVCVADEDVGLITVVG